MITQLAHPTQHREAAARSAAAYTQLVRTNRADPVIATSSQLAADMHRVLAAVWGKASASMDPETTFFRLASTATEQAALVPPPPNATVAELIASTRAHWSGALSGLNVPIVFPSTVLRTEQAVPDWARARTAFLHQMTPQQYVQARLAQRDQFTGARRVLAATDAYLVTAAMNAGDHALVTVYARRARLATTLNADMSAEDALVVVTEALGPVEMVRAEPFLNTEVDDQG